MYCPQDSPGISLLVQWLRLRNFSASSSGGTGSIPGWGTHIPHAPRPKQTNESKQKTVSLHLHGEGYYCYLLIWDGCVFFGRVRPDALWDQTLLVLLFMRPAEPSVESPRDRLAVD